MSEQSQTHTRPKSNIRNRFKLLVAALVAIATLVTAGWFVTSRLYAGAIEEQKVRLSEQGINLNCEEQSVGGFPARLEVRCDRLEMTDRNGTTVSGGEITTVAPVWNPTLTIVEWAGPVEVSGAGFETIRFNTDLIRSSLRLDRSMQLERLSVVADPLVIDVPSLGPALSTIQASEFHARKPVRSEQETADLEIALLLNSVEAPALDAFDALDLSLTGTAIKLANAQGNDPRALVFDWVTRSGEFEDTILLLRSGEHAVRLQGDGRLSGDGSLTFEGTLATNDVATLLSRLGIGDATTSSAIAAGAALFGRQTEIDGAAATELPVTVEEGRISIGPANLGLLPPIQF